MTAALASSLKVLLVDDNPDDVARFRRLVRREDWEVVSASNAEECEKSVQTIQPDVIILDYNLGETLGTDVLKRIREMGVQTPAIIQSGMPGAINALGGLPTGAAGFVSKNATDYPKEIVELIKTTASRRAPSAAPAAAAPASLAWNTIEDILGWLVQPQSSEYVCAGFALDRGTLVSAQFAIGRTAPAAALESLVRLAKTGPSLDPHLTEAKAQFLVLEFEGSRACLAPIPGVGTLFAALRGPAPVPALGREAFQAAVEALRSLKKPPAPIPEPLPSVRK